MTDQKRTRRLALMGYRSVGKSAITMQFVECQFVDTYNPTVENTSHKEVLLNGRKYFLELKDTAGQDEYSALAETLATDIDGYILVYTVTSRKSFDVIEHIWNKILDIKGADKVPAVLVGNKSDLQLERVVTTEDGKRKAAQMKIPFMETSAKQNKNIQDMFLSCLAEVEKLNAPKQENGGTKSSCTIS